jgi:cobalt/nickel transport system permease protein
MRIFVNPNTALVTRLDPRVRLVMTVLFAFLAVTLRTWPALGGALAAGLVLAGLSGVSTGEIVRRLAAANLFVLLLAVTVPISTPGTILFHVGRVSWSVEGFVLAACIGVRANAVLLACAGLLMTLESAHLGMAMTRIGVPAKFAHLFLFMVRYIEALHIEYHRLQNAMRLRAFVPRCNVHSLRSLGYLVGMLLVRSVDRADHVVAAMKCRGFRGKFYVLERTRIRSVDLWFCCGLCGVAVCLLWIETL